MVTTASDRTDGVMRLVRETAEGMAELVGKHLKLGRLELQADLVATARRARLTAVLGLLAIVGYALTMAGVAALLGGVQKVGFAFLAVGLAHVGLGAVGMALAATRTRAQLMNVTSDQAKLSLATFGSHRRSNGREAPRAV